MTALLMLVEPLDISKCLVTTFGTKQRLNFYTMLRTNYILLKKLGLQPVVCKSHHGGWGIIIWLESWVSRLKADEATKVEAESEVMNSRKENEANNTPVLVEADSCLIDTNGDNNEATETTEVVDIEAEVIKNKSTNKITCELIGHLNITKSGCSNIKSNQSHKHEP